MTFTMTVISLNISNLIYLTYLGIIWISDIRLQSDFAVKQKKWRSDFTCFVAFGILLWFTFLYLGHGANV